MNSDVFDPDNDMDDDKYIEQVEKDYPEIRKRVYQWTTHNPLMRRYAIYASQGRSPQEIADGELSGHVRNHLPWHAQGQRLLTLAYLTSPWPQEEGIEGEAQERVKMDTVLSLLGAQVYLWSSNMTAIVRQSPIPKHTMAAQSPYPAMFWVYEDKPEGLDGDKVTWRLLQDSPKALHITTEFGDATPDRSALLDFCEIEYGNAYPDDARPTKRDGGGIRSITEVLASLTFLNSPYVDSTSVFPPRPIRKEMSKETSFTPGTAEELDTRVVVLRRPITARKDNGEDGPGGVNWQHQWWNCGHVRNQWYATSGTHKLIWIAAFLKGPTDKPILGKTYMVER